MRELAVFYCPDCGHYAYYQTSRHPVCPKCGDGRTAMCMLKMYYTEFMNMTCEERDNYLSMEMLKRNPSIMARITESHKRFNSRETIAELCNVIMDLDALVDQLMSPAPSPAVEQPDTGSGLDSAAATLESPSSRESH